MATLAEEGTALLDGVAGPLASTEQALLECGGSGENSAAWALGVGACTGDSAAVGSDDSGEESDEEDGIASVSICGGSWTSAAIAESAATAPQHLLGAGAAA